MGLFTLSLPWLFASAWPVVVMCGVTIALLLAIRRSPLLQSKFGGVLGKVARCSYGEIYFSIGVATLFVWARNDHVHYLIAILLLTFADAAAALVGKRFGSHPYPTFGGQKSVEGSLTFLTVAVACIYVPLALSTNVDAVAALLPALTVALVLTLIEALASRGLDNLLLPLAAFVLLRSLRDWTSDELNMLLVGAVLLTLAFSLATGVHRFKKHRKGFIA